MLIKRLIIIGFLFLCSGCSLTTDKRVIISEPIEPVTSNQRWQRWIRLAPFVKKHFDTDDKTIKEIAFELYMAEYLLNKNEK